MVNTDARKDTSVYQTFGEGIELSPQNGVFGGISPSRRANSRLRFRRLLSVSGPT